MPELRAVIFDFDGVLVDTEPLHYEAFLKLWDPLGMTCGWEEYRRHYMGSDDRDALKTAFQRHRKPAPSVEQMELYIRRKAEFFNTIVTRRALPLLPGVRALLSEIREANIPMALCSGALWSDIEPVWNTHDLARYFGAVVTAEQVHRSKPAPESYERALTELEKSAAVSPIPPQAVWAVEDTPAGLQSARSAGLRVLAVTNTHEADALDEADRVVGSLQEISLKDLQQGMEAF